MVAEAESHATEDKERKEKVEARNQLDSLVYQVEKDVDEWGDKVATDTREQIDAAVERGKKALKQDDLDEINAAREELMQAFSAAGQQMYQAQQAEGAEAGPEQPETPGDEAGAAPEEEDVVEADYEIVEEEK